MTRKIMETHPENADRQNIQFEAKYNIINNSYMSWKDRQ